MSRFRSGTGTVRRVAFVIACAVLVLGGVACRNINMGAAEDLYARGDYGRAAEEYRQFIKDNPKSSGVPEAYIGLAWSEFKRGNYDEAAEAVEIFRGRWPAHRLTNTATYLHANVLVAQRRFVEAAAELQDLLRDAPEDPIIPDARFLLGRVEAALLRHASAAEQFRIYLDKYGEGPYAPAALLGRAEALAGQARWDEAASALDAFVRTFPGRPERPRAMLDLARFRVAQSEYAAAEVMLKALVRDYSDSTLLIPARKMLAEVYMAQAREDDAANVRRTLFDLLEESDTDAPALCGWLAEYYARQGDTETARRYYYRILGVYGRDTERHANALAWCALYELGRGDKSATYDLVMRYLERYYAGPQADLMERILVDLLVDGGRIREGRDRLVTFLHKNYTLARPVDFYRVAELSMRLRDYSEAIREAQEGLRRARVASDTPSVKSGLYHAMILQDLNGDLTKAVENWWRLKQLDPSYVTVEEKVYWDAQEDRFYRENRILPAMRGERAFRPPPHQAIHVAGFNWQFTDLGAVDLGRSLSTLFVSSITVHRDLDYVQRDKTRLVSDLVGRTDFAHLPDSFFPLRSTVGVDWIIVGDINTEKDADGNPATVVLLLRLLRVDYDGVFPFEYSYRIPSDQVAATAPGIVRETIDRVRLYSPDR